MAANGVRAEILERALRAAIDGDTSSVRQLCTEDVTIWAPGSFASSVDELVAELEHRDEAFSGVELAVSPLDVGGEVACVEWSASMTHSGAVALPSGPAVEPTGLRITVRGITVAEFAGDRICAVRQYFDELSVLEQLGVLRPAEDTTT
jgi:ketosteroid isomerase-like protein